MRYFELKPRCVSCEIELGLWRFKIKSGFLCSDCYNNHTQNIMNLGNTKIENSENISNIVKVVIFLLISLAFPILFLLSIPYAIYKFSKASFKNQHDAIKRHKVYPYLSKFVNTYINKASLYPSSKPEDISKADIQAFKSILDKDNIKITMNMLEILVKAEYEYLLDQYFEEAFLKSNLINISSATIPKCINAYVNTFENNLSYTNYLCRLLVRNRINTTESELKSLITIEISRRSQIKRMNSIKDAMDNNRAIERITLEKIDTMGGFEFEKFLSDLFSAMGYLARVTRLTGDQGADIILEKFGEKTVVQAKRYSNTVSNSAIQEVVAAKAHYNCKNAFVVTNNYFTKSAKELALTNNVALFDRDKLAELINTYL